MKTVSPVISRRSVKRRDTQRDLQRREREALEALAACAGERTKLAEGLVAALKERDAERERCAKIVEETPTSRSLYFNSETATALTDFKNYVAKLIRNRK